MQNPQGRDHNHAKLAAEKPLPLKIRRDTVSAHHAKPAGETGMIPHLQSRNLLGKTSTGESAKPTEERHGETVIAQHLQRRNRYNAKPAEEKS